MNQNVLIRLMKMWNIRTLEMLSLQRISPPEESLEASNKEDKETGNIYVKNSMVPDESVEDVTHTGTGRTSVLNYFVRGKSKHNPGLSTTNIMEYEVGFRGFIEIFVGDLYEMINT